MSTPLTRPDVDLGRRLGFTPDARGLVRVGIATTLAYVALAFVPDRASRVAREAAAWGAALVLLFLYAQGSRVVREAAAPPRRAVLLVFPALALAAACVWPFHSQDVYLYENAGRLQSAHGLDPYVAAPQDLPNPRADPLLVDTWDAEVFPYGPLFAQEARLVAGLAGDRLTLAVALFKTVNVLALAAAGALVLSTARRPLGRARPEHAAYLLLWSPFLLVHHVANAHNDLLVGLGVLAALRLALDGRDVAAAAVAALAAAVKAPAAVVLPFLWLAAARRRGAARAGLALLVAAAVLVVTAVPYLADLRDVRWKEIAASWSTPSYSLHAALLGAWHAVGRALPAVAAGEPTFRAVTQALLAAAFVAFLVVRLARATKRPAGDADGTIADVVAVLIALLCVASSRFGPWYGAMFLPAALLLPEHHALRRLALRLCAFELLAITFVGRARILDALVMTGVPLAWTWWEVSARGRRPSPGPLGP